MPNFPATPRTSFSRVPDRGTHDRETVYAILDEGMCCHIAVAGDGQALAIPSSYGRDGDTLYLHGSAHSRMTEAAAASEMLSLTVTLLDGLVLGKSSCRHSLLFRSVMLFGVPRVVDDLREKTHGLEVMVNHTVAGRWNQCRPPTDHELAAVAVVAFPIEEASAKVRTPPAVVDEKDALLPYWAGTVDFTTVAEEPVPAVEVDPSVAVPDNVPRGPVGRRV